MHYLTVLYDADCAMCRRARAWLAVRPQLVALRFVAAGSDQARRLFPALDPSSTLKTLTVVADSGAVYRGEKAWVVCLWALRDYRETAMDLSAPEMMPVARRFVAWISRHRKGISKMIP